MLQRGMVRDHKICSRIRPLPHARSDPYCIQQPPLVSMSSTSKALATKRPAEAEIECGSAAKKLTTAEAAKFAAETVKALKPRDQQPPENIVPVSKVVAASPQTAGMPPGLQAPKLPDLEEGRHLGAWTIMKRVIPWATWQHMFAGTTPKFRMMPFNCCRF